MSLTLKIKYRKGSNGWGENIYGNAIIDPCHIIGISDGHSYGYSKLILSSGQEFEIYMRLDEVMKLVSQ